MNGRDFLGTAQFLRNKGVDEAAFRSAISRAYYACFLEVRDVAFRWCDKSVLRKAAINRPADIRHEPLQKFLKYAPTEGVRSLGEDLASLHLNRREADYDMSEQITDADAEDAIGMAKAFLAALDGTPPVNIKITIEEYIHRTHR